MTCRRVGCEREARSGTAQLCDQHYQQLRRLVEKLAREERRRRRSLDRLVPNK